MATAAADRATDLFDFAVKKPKGFVYEDVDSAFGWTKPTFFATVRHLRGRLAEDEINLVCKPRGMCETWLYSLVATREDAKRWNLNRLDDMVARITTFASVAESIVRATSGRTIEGKKARVLHRYALRVIEDLADIEIV